MSLKVYPVEVRGVKYAVYLMDNGLFHVEMDNNTIEAASMELLTKKIMEATRVATAKISYKITKLQNGKCRDGEATGIHAKTRNVMVKWSDGHREQLSYVLDHNYDIAKALTAEQKAEYTNLAKAKNDSYTAYETFVAKFRVNLREEVQKLICEFLDKPEEEDQ